MLQAALCSLIDQSGALCLFHKTDSGMLGSSVQRETPSFHLPVLFAVGLEHDPLTKKQTNKNNPPPTPTPICYMNSPARCLASPDLKKGIAKIPERRLNVKPTTVNNIQSAAFPESQFFSVFLAKRQSRGAKCVGKEWRARLLQAGYASVSH